jgi:hypothetical protein
MISKYSQCTVTRLRGGGGTGLGSVITEKISDNAHDFFTMISIF